MDLIRQDLQYAFRYLRKHPAFTAIAALTIALGIGATTAIFSAVDGVLLSGLPYRDSEQLIRVWNTNRETGVDDGDLGAADIISYRGQAETIADVGGYFPYDVTFTDTEGNAQKVPAAAVSINMFDLLGVTPFMGRTFRQEDADQGQQNPRMVLGYSVWKSLYNSDPDIVGRSIIAEGYSIEIIGVAPEGFEFPRKMVAWGPMPIRAEEYRGARYLQGIARMNPGVTIEEARLELGVVASRLEQEFQDTNRNIGVNIMSLHRSIVGDLRPALLVLLGAAAVLLLIASVNVANLLLTRGAVRATEIAVRTALGAGRVRIIRQLLTESISLALVGGVGGIVLAAAIVRGIHAFMPEEMDLLSQTAIDGRVLAFTLVATGVAGLLFGLFPALAAGTPNLRAALTDGAKGSRGAGGARVRDGLVVLELALAVVLVLEAGLLVKSFRNLATEDPGFDPSGSLVAELSLPMATYAEVSSVADFYERYMTRLESSAGVTSVAAISSLPFGPQLDYRIPVFVKNREPPERGSEPQAYFRQVTPGFFTAMRIPILSGRDFERFDRADARPVAIINDACRRLLFPDDDPIGEYLVNIPQDPFGPLGRFLVPEVEIVGVVGDFKFSSLGERPEPSVFFVHQQAPFRRMTLAIRTAGDPLQLVPTVRSDLATLDRTMALGRVESFERVIAGSYARQRFSMLLLTGFALVALALAVIGIYGVISFSVQQRTTEMAIRMAMGAQPSNIIKLVLRHGSILAALGVASGLLGAWGAGRITASQMYGTSPNDPAMFVGVAVALTGVALLASLFPALRATKIHPAEVLKPE